MLAHEMRIIIQLSWRARLIAIVLGMGCLVWTILAIYAHRGMAVFIPEIQKTLGMNRVSTGGWVLTPGKLC